MRAAFRRSTAEPPSVHGPAYSSEELAAFVAARDLIVRQAEANTTELNLRRAAAANEFVAACIGSSVASDSSVLLTAGQKAREEKRCDSLKLRLAELRLRQRLRPVAA
jgi:hypothetical protein